MPPKVRSRLLRFAPVALGDVVAVHPDLADLARRLFDAGSPGRRCASVAGPRRAIADQLGSAARPSHALRVARPTASRVETGRRRRACPVRRSTPHTASPRPGRRRAAGRAVRKVEAGEPLGEPLDRRDVDPFGPADDGLARPPGRGRPCRHRTSVADGQLEREVRRGARRVGVAGQSAASTGRACCRNASGLINTALRPASQRRADTQDEAHVVVEGQPRHDHRVLWRLAVVVEVVLNRLAHVGRDIAVRDDHPRRSPGGAGRVLQVRRPGPGLIGRVERRGSNPSRAGRPRSPQVPVGHGGHSRTC